MKEKILHVSAAFLFFIWAMPGVALLADMPVIKTIGHYYCDFMTNYELAQKVLDDAQGIYLHRLSSSKQALQVWHERVCTFACWKNNECKNLCMQRKYPCENFNFFGPRTVEERVASIYKDCHDTFLDEIFKDAPRKSQSWWEFFTSRHCPDPLAGLKVAMAHLDRELEHQCATMKDDPSVNVTAIESRIAFAKQRAPNFDSVAFAGVTRFGHIACALKTVFLLHSEEESKACYEHVLQNHIDELEELLGYAHNFKQMCQFLAKSHLGNIQP